MGENKKKIIIVKKKKKKQGKARQRKRERVRDRELSGGCGPWYVQKISKEIELLERLQE